MLEAIDNVDVSYKTKSKNKTVICRMCRSIETRSKSDGSPIWTRDIDSHGIFTGSYLCYKCTFESEKSCYKCGTSLALYKHYDDKEYWTGIYVCNKCTTDCRNKNLDPDSSTGKGYITEALVSRFLGIKTCFEITNNFNYPRYDLLEHEDWGKIDIKGSTLHSSSDNYYFHYFNIKKNVVPDFFFCIGYDEHMRHVDRVYIIPNEKYINKLDNISISRDGYSIYHIFREYEKPWDELFHTMRLDGCPVLKNRDGGTN